MPKKTRKEKVIAAYRKKIKLLEQMEKPSTPGVTTSFAKSEPIGPIEDAPPIIIEEKPIINKEETALKTFFIKDLKKSLLLIGLIIALEIIIYFGTINNYFKL